MRNFCRITCCLVCILHISSILGLSTPAKAEDVEVNVELSPEKNSKSGNKVKLTLKGKTYYPNGWFDQIEDTGNATPAEKFVIKAVATYKKGTMNDVQKLWMPDEQHEFVKRYTDPQVFASNQSFFRRLTRARFKCKILYGDYVIFLVQHEIEGYGSRTMPYTLKKIKGKFYISNKLKGDPVFHYLSQKCALTLTQKEYLSTKGRAQQRP